MPYNQQRAWDSQEGRILSQLLLKKWFVEKPVLAYMAINCLLEDFWLVGCGSIVFGFCFGLRLDKEAPFTLLKSLSKGKSLANNKIK